MQKKILLVEDEVIIALMQMQQLKKEGYDVIHVADGEEGFEVVNDPKESIDLILMDIDLGIGMDGTETAKKILEKHDIPIIFLSSRIEKEMVQKTEQITSYGYVVKNSGITVLDASIKMAFKLYEANKRTEFQKEQLRTIIHSIGDAVIATDIEGRITQMNPIAEELTGWNFVEANGKELLEVFNIISSKSRTRIQNPVEQVLATGNIIGLANHTLLIAKNGQESPISDSGSPIRDSAGKITGVVLVFRDVTQEYRIQLEQKRNSETIKHLNETLQGLLSDRTQKLEEEIKAHAKTEKSWIESEDRFRVAQDISLEAFTIMRSIRNEKNEIIDFVWTYANSVAGKTLKIPPKELVGQRLLKLLPGNKESEELFSRYVRIVETGVGDEVELKYQSDGIDGWFRNMAVKLGDGIAISFSDITKRKQAELILRESRESLTQKIDEQTNYLKLANEKLELEVKDKERYATHLRQEKLFSETLISSLPGVFYRINSKSQLLGWNRNLELLVGHVGIELAKLNVLDIIHPDDKETITNAISSVFTDGQAETGGRIISSSGEYRNFFLVGKKWSVEGEEFLLGTGIDVTEFKLAAENVQKLLYEKEMILKEVYHRVKNNMNTIYSLLSIQANTLEESENRSILLDSASRVQSMMLLYDKLYRSDSNGTILLKEYLPSLINEIIQVYPQSSFIEMKTEIDSIVLNAKIVSTLGILINEFITNAIKYAFVGRKNGMILIRVFREEEFITLIFQDDGVGIQENISFDDSTGFGLNLIGILTKQLKGTIRIERENGTRFILRFQI